MAGSGIYTSYLDSTGIVLDGKGRVRIKSCRSQIGAKEYESVVKPQIKEALTFPLRRHELLDCLAEIHRRKENKPTIHGLFAELGPDLDISSKKPENTETEPKSSGKGTRTSSNINDFAKPGVVLEKGSCDDFTPDEACYEMVFEELCKEPPSFLQRSFLGCNKDGNIKICLDVDSGRKRDMIEIILKHFPEYPKLSTFDILEQSGFKVLADFNLTAQGSNTEYLFGNDDSPGTKLLKVQSGSLISIIPKPDIKQIDDYGVVFSQNQRNRRRYCGTLGAIMQNKVNKQYYAITARHVLQCGSYTEPKVHSFCKILPSPCLKKPFIHLGQEYLAPDETEDIAAIPVLPDAEAHQEVFFWNSRKEIVDVVITSVKSVPLYTPINVRGAQSESQGRIINQQSDEFIGGKPYRNVFLVGYGNSNAVTDGDSGALITDVIHTQTSSNAYGLLFAVSNGPYVNRRDGQRYNCASVNQCLQSGLKSLFRKHMLDLEFCNSLKLKRTSSKSLKRRQHNPRYHSF